MILAASTSSFSLLTTFKPNETDSLRGLTTTGYFIFGTGESGLWRTAKSGVGKPFCRRIIFVITLSSDSE